MKKNSLKKLVEKVIYHIQILGKIKKYDDAVNETMKYVNEGKYKTLYIGKNYTSSISIDLPNDNCEQYIRKNLPNYDDYSYNYYLIQSPDSETLSVGPRSSNKEDIADIKKEDVGSNENENTLANLISKTIDQTNPNTSIDEFSLAIADILKNEYGEHNYDRFLRILKKKLYNI